MLNRAFLAALLATFILGAQPAQAYIDLGSGSYFLQFLLAMALGSLVYIKNIWRAFLGVFGRGSRKNSE